MQRVYDSVCNSTSECKAEAVDEFPPQKKRRRSARLRSSYGLTQPSPSSSSSALGPATGSPSSQRAPARRGAAWTRPTSTAGFSAVRRGSAPCTDACQHSSLLGAARMPDRRGSSARREPHRRSRAAAAPSTIRTGGCSAPAGRRALGTTALLWTAWVSRTPSGTLQPPASCGCRRPR